MDINALTPSAYISYSALAVCNRVRRADCPSNPEYSGLFPILSSVDGGLGFIDRTGRLAINPEFKPCFEAFRSSRWVYFPLEPNYFSDGRALVGCANMQFINEQGEIVTPQFAEARRFSEGLAAAKDSSGRFGYIDLNGAFVVKPQFEQAGEFCNGVTRVQAERNDTWTLIDREGRLVLGQPVEGSLFSRDQLTQDFSEGVAVVQMDGSYGYIDTTGKMAIPFHYDKAENFSGGFAVVRQGTRTGYIDLSGRFIFSLVGTDLDSPFDDFQPFSEGLAAVKVCPNPEDLRCAHKVYGYIDKNGTWAVTPHYEEALSFRDGLALVVFNYTVSSAQKAEATEKGKEKGKKKRKEKGKETWEDEERDKCLIHYGYIREDGAPVFEGRFMAPLSRWRCHSGAWRTSRGDYEARRSLFFGIGAGVGAALGAAAGTGSAAGKSAWIAFGASFSPEDLLSDVTIETLPSGAKVYLIPLEEFDSDPTVIQQPDKLRLYLQSEYTPLSKRVYAQVYEVLLELAGKRATRLLDVNKSQKSVVRVDFAKEP